MKIVAISDTHGALPDIPACDVFIHAGDICPTTNHTRAFQANWLAGYFNLWLRNIPAKHKIVIAGNHDWIFYDAKNMLPKLPCHYLEESGIEIEGVKFWGSPWSPFFCNWAFNFPEDDDGTYAERHWSAIPDGTDILITHGPGYGHGDSVWQRHERNKLVYRAGCKKLLAKIMKIRPKRHLYGHIHTGQTPPSPDALSKIAYTDGNTTICHNVSVLNESYKMTGKPTIIEI